MTFFEQIFAWRSVGPKQWLMVLAGVLFIFCAWKRRALRRGYDLCDRGFYFIPELPVETVRSLQQGLFLNKAILEAASPVMKGEDDDIFWTIFNTAYSAGSGKKQKICNHTIVCTRMQGQAFPSVQVVSLPFLVQSGISFLPKSNVFARQPGLAQKYAVRAFDPEQAKKLFKGRVCSYLKKNKRDFWFCLYGDIFVCCFLTLSEPDRFSLLLEEAEDLLFRLLP